VTRDQAPAGDPVITPVPARLAALVIAMRGWDARVVAEGITAMMLAPWPWPRIYREVTQEAGSVYGSQWNLRKMVAVPPPPGPLAAGTAGLLAELAEITGQDPGGDVAGARAGDTG
jgi:hypothetical protein